eukprot:8727625-Pyramimonas_sp.AAC.2
MVEGEEEEEEEGKEKEEDEEVVEELKGFPSRGPRGSATEEEDIHNSGMAGGGGIVPGWLPAGWGRGWLLIGKSDKPLPEGEEGGVEEKTP